MTQSPILVTGATGTIGSEVARLLVRQGRSVRALVRDPAKAKKLAGVDIVVADLSDPATLAPAFDGIRTAFIASNGLDIATLEANAYQAARAAGVERIVKLSGRHLDAEFMKGTPLAANQTASEEALRQSGMGWTIVRPGFFSSNFLMFVDRERGIVALPVGEGKETPTDPRDIAAVMVEALTRPGHEGSTYEVTGPEYLTYAEMVRRIAAATGKSITLVDVPSDAARDGMVAAGMPATQAEGLLRYFQGVREGKIYPPTATIEELLGRPALSFGDWLRDNAGAFK